MSKKTLLLLAACAIVPAAAWLRPGASPEQAQPRTTAAREGKTTEGPGPVAPPVVPPRHPEIERCKDPSVRLEERRRGIAVLAQEGSERSIRALMALGREKTYLNWAAIEALGRIPKGAFHAEVVEYLESMLFDADARIVGAAMIGLARAAGEGAIPAIADAMRRNRVRPDGFQEIVLSMGVSALETIGSPKGVPVLTAELARSEDKGWTLEYGSRVVTAIGRLGTTEGSEAADAYASRLAARFPTDPLAAAYFTKKIDEARAAAR
jgi:hypothetical protein